MFLDIFWVNLEAMCSELPFLVRVFVEHFECANI